MFGKLFSLFKDKEEVMSLILEEDFEELDEIEEGMEIDDFFEDPNVISYIKYL